MVQPVHANVAIGHCLTQPLHSERDEGETERCQSPIEEKPISSSQSSLEISYTVSVTLLQWTSRSGDLFSIIFPFWLSFQLYMLIAINKRLSPSFISFKRYLLCPTFSPPIESTCTKIISFILLIPFIIIGFDRLWDSRTHFIHCTVF